MSLRLGPVLRIASLATGIAWAGWQPGLAQSAADAAEKVRRANALVQAEKPEQAIPIYRELVAAFPKEPSLRVNLAVAQYKAGRYQEAVEQCQTLVEQQPELFPAWLFLGASQLKLGQAGSAVEALRKAAALQPGDLNARLMLADALLEQQQYKEAAGEYVEAEKAMPESPRVWYGLGRSYEGAAGEVFERQERARPGSAEVLALAGDFEFERGQSARALRQYREALALRPEFRGLHAAIAEIYGRTGHPDWAAVERAREARPGADCHGQTPECEFAAGHFEQAATAFADTPEQAYWQAKAFQTLAQSAYARLRELPPSRERAEATANAYEKGGRYRESAAAWREALQLAKGDMGIQRRLALALCHSNDCGSALPMIRDLLGRDKSSAEFHYLYGLALLEIHDPAQAIQYLEIALQRDSKFQPAHGALGEAYLEVGRWELAIPQLEAALAEDDSGTRHYQLARAYQGAGKQERAAAMLREYREILSRHETEDRNAPRITAP
ncbi:MAG: tetratricopeptide repeat protein [Bryobacteraceae bacterium]|jgi:predicted Zn-dependent protease